MCQPLSEKKKHKRTKNETQKGIKNEHNLLGWGKTEWMNIFMEVVKRFM